ncbi:MAG: RHS repeat protein, partial [Myxococcaceae bacterium]
MPRGTLPPAGWRLSVFGSPSPRTDAMDTAAPPREGELSTSHNFHDPLTSDVNLRNGRVHLVIAAPVVPGLNGLDVDLGIEYSQPLPGTDHRILGLPAPWRYRLSYIVGGQLVINGGATYTVDPKSPQGLKYFTLKSMRLETFDAPRALPFDERTYLSILSFLNGMRQYFDKGGRLIATADAHGNHVLYYYNAPEDVDVRTTTLEAIVDSYGQTFFFTHEENATEITYPSGGVPRSIRYEFYTTSNVLRMKRYVGPTGRETRFTHTDGLSVKGLLSKIEAPSGLITEFTYGSILARRPEKVDEKLDTVAKVTRTFQGASQTTTYTYGPGKHNYTGYPILFFKSELVDSLLSSGKYHYEYTTIVDDGITRTLHQYNHLHLEMLTKVSTSTSPVRQISLTQYRYPGQRDFGRFPPLKQLPPYYQQPSRVEILTRGLVKRQTSGSRQSVHVQVKTFTYNGQGQITKTKEGVSSKQQDTGFGMAFSPLFDLEKEESFIYDSRFGLETQHDVRDYIATGALPNRKSQKNPVVTRRLQTLNAAGSLVEKSEVGFVKKDVFEPAQRTTFAHDAQGRLTRQELKDLTQGNGLLSVQEISYSYDTAEHRLTLTAKDALGNSVSREIDTTLGLLVSEADARGNTSTHTYDDLGRRTSTVDPLNTTTRWIHDDTLRTVTEEQANGYKTVTEFNSLGLVTRQTDNAGPNHGARTLSARTYDGYGRLTSESGILGDASKVTHAYDQRGRLARLTDALGNETTYTYDEGALIRSESFNGILSRKLTLNDRQEVILEVLVSSTPGPSQITLTRYNSFGKLVLKKQGNKAQPDALTHRITRDAVGRAVRTQVQAKDGTQVIHEESQDLFGNVTGTTRKLVKGTDTTSARSQSFQYDAANRLTQTTLALGQAETYAYDGNGNLTSWKDLAGTPFTQEYDARNALTRTTFTDAGVNHTLVRTHEPQTGRLLSMEHSKSGQPSDKTVYTYTADGLLTSVQYQPDGKTLKWEYSPQTNQLVRFTDAAGTRFLLTYTPQGQLKSKALDPLPLLPTLPPALPPPLGFILE